MSIRKLWLLVLTLVAILSIAINTFILASLTDRYFKAYLNETYDEHISQMVTYIANTLQREDISISQMTTELENHLDDPIVRIKLYDADGELLVEVEDVEYDRRNFSHMGMMNFMFRVGEEEIDNIDVMDNGEIIGKLNITKQSSAESSIIAVMFKSRLFINSLISTAIALIVTLFAGAYLSKRMSKDLSDTAQLASNIQIGEALKHQHSTIKEINQIQNSLHDLNTRLRLKQKSRKTLIDQLIHQSKTPLTILKSHIEAIEDNVIEVTPKEIEVFQNQIDHLNNILTNMSTMIDAENEDVKINLENIDVMKLLNEIFLGIHSQFDKKGIGLELIGPSKSKILTDSYKLSQVFYNLLTNAYKYTEKGSVLVKVSEADSQLTIEISDTGIGIDSHELSRIYDAYYRGSSSSQIPGEGIGLFVVKENINILGGTIDVFSKPGKGSTFILKLPKTYIQK